MDLFTLDWDPNDILIILGVSNHGFPLAVIEASVLASGAKFINYNTTENNETIIQTSIGDVSETFKFLDHRNLPPIELTEIDIGFIVDQIECNILGDEYTIYQTLFSQSKNSSQFRGG